MHGSPFELRAEARARARVGSTLHGKYLLERLLGVGGMASVYAATHRNTKRVAVKVLHRELSSDDDLRARFIREGYVANSVAHPGAVAVLDDDASPDGETFLVMELLEGEAVDTLWHRLGSRLPVRTALAIADALLDVLSFAHAKSIVHRDIKPGNLFLTQAGELKVLDFGVARLREVSGSGVTQSGMTMGTPAFMAPEQALGRADEIDGRSDLWSVGATLFVLLSGRLVHQAPSAQEVMIWTATRPAGSLAAAAPDVPPSVVGVVDKALQFAREDRWESASAMREAVRGAFLAVEGEPLTSRILPAISVAPQVRIHSQAPAQEVADPMGQTAPGPIEATPPSPMGSASPRASSTAPPAMSLTGAQLRAQRAPRHVQLMMVASTLLALVAVAGAVTIGLGTRHTPTVGAGDAVASPPPSVARPEPAPPPRPPIPSAPAPSVLVDPPPSSSASASARPRLPPVSAHPPALASARAPAPSASAPAARDEFDHQ